MESKKRLPVIVVVLIVVTASGILSYLMVERWSYDNSVSILSNDDFTTANGVSSGSGTDSDPFVIQGLRIRLTSHHSVGIFVRNTTVHFLITDVEVRLDRNPRDFEIHMERQELGAGISLYDVDNAVVGGCKLIGSGIKLSYCGNSSLRGNSMWECGFSMSDCQNCVLDGNLVEISGGAYVDNCRNCRISNNSLESPGLYFQDGPEDSGFLVVTPDNTISGEDLLYLRDVSGVSVIDRSIGQLVLFNCSGVVIRNVSSSGGVQVFVAVFVTNMTVTDCEFSDGGKMFVSCCRSFVIDSCIFDERLLFMNCTEFEISNCTDVPQQQVGLHLDSCHRFNVTGNVIDGRAYDSVIGCSLMSCDNATLSRNILSNCSSGLWMSSCRDIRVFHNDFLENDKDASVTMTKTTHPNVSWDNGYPSGGNYWSNFSSLDAFGGPDQDTAGSDGIMDEPYVVPGEGVVIPERTDRYPLAAPYSS